MTDQEVVNKMLNDLDFAYQYLKDNLKNSFHYHFNKYEMKYRGFIEDELFQDFYHHLVLVNEKGACILASFDPKRGKLKSWISTIIRNFIVDLCRQKKLKIDTSTDIENLEDKDASEYCLNYEIDEDTAEYKIKRVEETIQGLKNNKYRTIIEEFLINGTDIDDIMDMLELSSSEYNVNLMRALNIYLPILQKEGIINEDSANYILAARRRPRQTEPGVMGFMMTMSCLTTMPITNSPYQWLIDRLRELAARIRI